MTANIPVHKISNTEFRKFLEKYTLHAVPSESTLRKTYTNDCYDECMSEIRQYITGNKIWVSIDETTDVEGRYIANVVVGTLLSDGPGKIFFLTTEVLEKSNYSTITKLFDNAMFLLWPNGIRHNDVLLFLSDAAPYMKKAGDTIKVLYPKIIYVTCLAHGLHRVAEEVRVNYPKVDKLVSSVKQIFLKAPSRTVLFKTVNPGIPLPPEPILTRWGTWIEATSYYCKYFSKIRDVVRQLDPIDAVSIKKAQNLVNQRSMEPNLIFIDSNYGFLPTKIKQLETQGVKLSKTIKEITQTKKKIEEVSSEVGVAIQKKLRYVLEKNRGFETMMKISMILTGDSESMDGLPEELTGDDLKFYKYAPMTSTDVERSFSRYKNLLSNNRRSFEIENLMKILVVQCNNLTGIRKHFRVETIQDNHRQMNTNETRSKPAMITIKNAPTFLTTNNISVPKVYDSPSRKNKKLESELDKKSKLQKSTNELSVNKLAIKSLINKPACLITNKNDVTGISDPPNGKKENSEYKINQIRTDQNNGKVIQDKPRPTITNEWLNPATITNGCTCSVSTKLVLNMRKKNLENELDQKRKLWNSDRRVMIQDDKSGQTNKDEPRAKPATMSIKQAPVCSTVTNISEPVVDSTMNVENSAMERIRKLRHRLDFPNEPRENLPQMSMKNASPCSIKKYVSVPDVSKPNWRMEYLERDTFRIVKNDVMCVNNVNQFLKTLFR
ncbi:hypothetical protein QTP88_005305 [Uroleucon formosanum]